MAVIETWFEQDLQKAVQVQHLDGSLFSNNANGNRIGVVVYNNGVAASLSGTVSGYAVLPDGTTVPCTGSLSGNRASVLIPAAAYQPGIIFVSVFLTSGSTVTTLAAVAANVQQARTDSQVSPGSVVTDWTQTINAAMQSVVTANAANMAVEYGSLTYPVPAGKYTIYNDLLYRCITPIATAESWTASHWTRVRIADEVSDLKSALNGTGLNYEIDFSDSISGKGVFSDGRLQTNADYSYLPNLEIKENDTILFKGMGWNSAISMISKQNGNSFVPLVLSSTPNEPKTYMYTATEDMMVALTFDNRYVHEGTVSIYAKDIIESTPTFFENTTKQIDIINSDLNDFTETINAAYQLELTTNKLIGSDGIIYDYPSSANFAITQHIDMTGETDVYITTTGRYGNNIYGFFDQNDNFISGQLSPNALTQFTDVHVVVPSGASYLIVSKASNTQISVKRPVRVVTNTLPKWTGKKWVAFGDSLTEVNSRTTKHYHDYIAEKTGISVINMGVSGSGYARRKDEDLAFYQRILNIDTTADVVTIFGSFNDLGSGLELGTRFNQTPETIAGCINQTINNLYSVMPLVQLGIVAPTPWDTTNPWVTESTASQYVDMLKEICFTRSIPFLDLFHESNLRPWNAEFRQLAYSKDDGSGTHPDETGHAIIAPRFEAFLDSLLLH